MDGKFYDPRYEFDVPTVVDFNNLEEYDPDIESYFDVDHESDIPLDFGPTEPKRTKNESEKFAPRRSLRNTPARQKHESKIEQNKENAASKSKRSTLPKSETPQNSEARSRTRSMGVTSQPGSAESKEQKTSKRDPNHKPAGLCTSLTEWNSRKAKTSSSSQNPSPKNQQPRRLPLKATSKNTTTSTKLLKSTEELELEKIQALREEASRQKKKAERSHRRVLSSGPSIHPKHSAATTKVEEFAFATDKRVPDSKAVKANTNDMKDFSTMLRHYEPQKTLKKGPTIPIETNLYMRKRKHSEERPKSPAPLWSKTPDRFHTLPRNAKFELPSNNKRRRSQSYNCKITVPLTPKLECTKRARPVHVVSQKEIEEKEAAEIKSYKFKARPMNERIFKNPSCGVPRRKAREATVAKSPDFATDKRIAHYHATKEEEDAYASFHARPIPKNILEAPQGIKEVNPKALTHPKSPAFALKNRLRSLDKSAEIEDDHIIRATPLPNLEDVFMPKISRSVVRVEPFSQEFNARTETGLRKKELKIAQLKEEQERVLEEHRSFRARNPQILTKEPFIPAKSTLPLTDASDFTLNTSRRHNERQDWEMYKAENERRVAEIKVNEERRRQQEEKEDVERIRREAVHRAQPVRHYKNVIVEKSTLPLTRAQSPRFSRRLRERNPNV